MPKLAGNLSMMFGNVDLLDRFEAAARVGFRGAEIQMRIPVKLNAESGEREHGFRRT